MAWIIYSKDKEIPLRDVVVLGREEFSLDKLLSRQHVEFTVRGDRVFVKDLDSTNGTYFGGERLVPKQEKEFNPGDRLMIGGVELQIRHEREERATPAPASLPAPAPAPAQTPVSPEIEAATEVKSRSPRRRRSKSPKRDPRWSSPSFLGKCVLPLLLLLTMLDPSLALGRSIGFLNLIVVVGCLCGATGLAALVWSWILRPPGFSLQRSVGFVFVTLATAIAFYSILIYAIDAEFKIAHSMIENKIKYFCVNHFDQPQCVRQVALCPLCAASTDRWERLPAVEKLKAFRSQYPAGAAGSTRSK